MKSRGAASAPSNGCGRLRRLEFEIIPVRLVPGRAALVGDLHVLAGQFHQELAGNRTRLLASKRTVLGHAKLQFLLSSRDPDEQQPPFLFQSGRIVAAQLVG